MTPAETIKAIQARSIPMARTMVDQETDQDDSYYSGYLAGYVHASDRAVDLIEQITYADVTRQVWGDTSKTVTP